MPQQGPEKTTLELIAQDAIDERGDAAGTGSAAGSAWTDPSTGFTAESSPEKTTTNESVDTSEQGRLSSLERTETGYQSLEHMPSGTFTEHTPDGDKVENIAKDSYLTIKGSARIIVDGGKYIDVSGVIKIEASGVITIDGPQVVIQGGSLLVDATTPVVANGRGGFCALPACLFTGAPHIGNEVNSDGS